MMIVEETVLVYEGSIVADSDDSNDSVKSGVGEKKLDDETVLVNEGKIVAEALNDNVNNDAVEAVNEPVKDIKGDDVCDGDAKFVEVIIVDAVPNEVTLSRNDNVTDGKAVTVGLSETEHDTVCGLEKKDVVGLALVVDATEAERDTAGVNDSVNVHSPVNVRSPVEVGDGDTDNDFIVDGVPDTDEVTGEVRDDDDEAKFERDNNPVFEGNKEDD